MAKQTINVGTLPNDGTGDTLRVAFEKANSNFTELYSGAIPGSSGFSGWSGFSGASGYSGEQGISGFSGESGISGFSGISGYSGPSGLTAGSWILAPGSNSVNFTVPDNASYVMWVNGNIPNGIVVWNATVTITNTNVPVIGTQYAWYYVTGNELVLTAIPDQITGSAGTISTTSPLFIPPSNTFRFVITNNNAASQTVNYGYIKIS